MFLSKSGSQESVQIREGEVTMETEKTEDGRCEKASLQPCLSGSRDTRRSQEPRDVSGLTAGKSKEIHSSVGTPEGSGPVNTLISAQ